MSDPTEPDPAAPDFEPKMRDLFRYGKNVKPLRPPGHYCTQCEKRIEPSELAPIEVLIRDPGGNIGPEGMTREFCSWECLADWTDVQAGRAAPPRFPGMPEPSGD